MTEGAPAENGAGATDDDNGRAIDALRAATTAAGDVGAAAVDRRHRADSSTARDATSRPSSARDARSPKPGARRRFQYALDRRGRRVAHDRLRVVRSVRRGVRQHRERERARQRSRTRRSRAFSELLTELGVDPHGDPLRAASEFLTTHEGTTADSRRRRRCSQRRRRPNRRRRSNRTRAVATTGRAGARAASRSPDARTSPRTRRSRPSAERRPRPSRRRPERRADRRVASTSPSSRRPSVERAGARRRTGRSPTSPTSSPTTGARRSRTEPETAADGRGGADRARRRPRPPTRPPDLEPDAPWVPAAQLPPRQPSPRSARADDDVRRPLDPRRSARRAHARRGRPGPGRARGDARAVGRSRADRRDPRRRARRRERRARGGEPRARACRQRVEELERSIARSDAERDELERALDDEPGSGRRARSDVVGARARVHASASAIARRRSTTAAELEATLAARTSELEQARSVGRRARSRADRRRRARLDHTRGELGAAAPNADELTAELETTRRALDALDAHAEAIEAELAEARRAADNPETAPRARGRAPGARPRRGTSSATSSSSAPRPTAPLAHDRIELQQLQHTLATTRDEAIVGARRAAPTARRTRRRDDRARSRRPSGRARRSRSTPPTSSPAPRPRPRACSSGPTVTPRRSARKPRSRPGPASARPTTGGPATGATFGDDTLADIVERIERLERKLAKQRRRLDRISRTADAGRRSRAPKPRADAETRRQCGRRARELVAIARPDTRARARHRASDRAERGRRDRDGRARGRGDPPGRPPRARAVPRRAGRAPQPARPARRRDCRRRRRRGRRRRAGSSGRDGLEVREVRLPGGSTGPADTISDCVACGATGVRRGAMPHSAGSRSPLRALHDRHDATTLSHVCGPAPRAGHDVVEVLGGAPAVLAAMAVAGEHRPPRQRRAGAERDAYEVHEADHRRHRNRPALGAELGTVAVHDLGLLLQHQHDRPPRRHDAERLEAGVEQERPGHAVPTSSATVYRRRPIAAPASRRAAPRTTRGTRRGRPAGARRRSPYAVSSRNRRYSRVGERQERRAPPPLAAGRSRTAWRAATHQSRGRTTSARNAPSTRAAHDEPTLASCNVTDRFAEPARRSRYAGTRGTVAWAHVGPSRGLSVLRCFVAPDGGRDRCKPRPARTTRWAPKHPTSGSSFRGSDSSGLGSRSRTCSTRSRARSSP